MNRWDMKVTSFHRDSLELELFACFIWVTWGVICVGNMTNVIWAPFPIVIVGIHIY